jgi:hypothetical protein
LHYEIHMNLLGGRGIMLWFKEMYLVIRLTRDRLVMANFDCQLDWIKKHLVKYTARCIYDGISRKN